MHNPCAENIDTLLPKWRAVIAETSCSGVFDATTRINCFGKIASDNDHPVGGVLLPAGAQSCRADVSFDFEVGITFAERYQSAVGAENLFDRYPQCDVRKPFSQTGAAGNGRVSNDALPLSYMGDSGLFVAGSRSDRVRLRDRVAVLGCRASCSPTEEIVSMKAIFTLLAATLVIAAPAIAAPIVRHTNPPPAIILNGVTIPPGAETVLLSGQLANPIVEGKAATIEDYGDTKTQTVSTFNKIKAALAKLGYAMSDIVKLTVFVAGDPKLGGKMDFAGFNAGYREFFGTAENPNLVARSTVQVAALAGPNFLIEIEAIAAKAPKGT
jgi:enamine deaminase RidA (YjgF/YER057c/UK114 family)